MASRWLKTKLLGQGSCTSVFLGKPTFSSLVSRLNIPMSVAIKSIPKNYSRSLMQEKQILYELRGCPHVVRSYDDEDFMEVDDQDGEENYNIVLECADRGNLEELVKSRGGRLPEQEASWYVCMLLKGLSHVHEEGYVHCDMKLSNVLIFNIPSDKYKKEVKYNVKIADFRLAKKGGEISFDGLGLDYKNRGTLIYSSPESVVSGVHEAPMDIWSLGCMLVEMLLGDGGLWKKFRNDDERRVGELIATYEDNNLSILLPDLDVLSDNAKDFVRKCLRKNDRERWTANQLLKHPFITHN